ncbi:MAG: hypothetical protein GXO10_06850 [Crenarchaeota archaeon]|nr:hypothetical protein [Thermoproteota archaeon]
MKNLLDKIDEQEIRPENGAVIIYVGVVKGERENKKISEVEVIHDKKKIEEELNKNFKEDIDKENIKIKLIDGKLRPGEPITIIQIQAEDRYIAVIKLLKILDIVKKNTIIREYYDQ